MLAEIVSLFILLCLSAFFSGSEAALMFVSKLRVRRLAQEDVKNAIILQKLLEHPHKLLATIVIGNTIVNIAAASVATSMAIKLFGSRGVGIAAGVMTLLILMFGEITPKGFATKNAERIALNVAKPVEALVYVFSPLVKALTKLTNSIIRVLGGEVKKSTSFVTEEEIKLLVSMGEEEGSIEKEEKEMIHSIFEFGETTAREVMVPRTDMVCVDAGRNLEYALNAVIGTGHTRIPVYEGSVDNIIGLLYSKDLLRHLKEEKEVKLKEIVRPAYFVPETKKLDELLRELQERKIHMAIVMDEYGGTEGLITIEDILEEIVGEILDEYEIEERPIQKIDKDTFVVNARVTVKAVNKALNLNLPEEYADTVGGLIFNAIGKIPSIGEKIETSNAALIVEKMRGRRVTKVKLIKK